MFACRESLRQCVTPGRRFEVKARAEARKVGRRKRGKAARAVDSARCRQLGLIVIIFPVPIRRAAHAGSTTGCPSTSRIAKAEEKNSMTWYVRRRRAPGQAVRRWQ